MNTTPEQFMAASAVAPGGNTPWASRYAAELRRVVVEHAQSAPRSRQVRLGPSELGVACDRQVVGKLAGLPRTNHVADPWPSVVGTAVHAWLAAAFAADNTRSGALRWVPEQRVTPHPEHSGTADLYDAAEQAVVDHKVLGESSMAKIRRPEGPPRKYRIQLLLYATGYRALGLPVQRVALAAYPRTATSLNGLYVWEHVLGPADDAVIREVFDRTKTRKELAGEVAAGRMRLNDIPAAPDDDECFFCVFYRPESAQDDGPGCPGAVTAK